MWKIFQGTWAQRNAIVHDKEVGFAVSEMDKELRHIYNYAYHFIRPSDMHLVDNYTLEEAIN